MQNLQNQALHQEAKPLVTFIIAYYDLPVQMLCQCINSILSLPLQPAEREIIIIDDGSKVSPVNALMQYNDNTIYVRQQNQGLSMARNKGIEMACGRYIQFVDADDHLLLEPYEHCLELLRNHHDIDMVLFDFTTEDTNMTTFSDMPPMSGTEYMLHHNIHGTAWGYLFQKKTLGALRFTPGIWHEDEEFTPQLLIRAEQIIVTDAKAYYYNKRPQSITTSDEESKKDKRLNDLLGVILRLRDICDQLPQNDRMAMQRRIAQLTMDSIYQVIMQKQSADALHEHISTLKGKGLFPLPDRDYSQKYKWFRVMTISSLGRHILLKTLPLIKKER